MLLAEIAGLLIDTGSEGKNEQGIKDGLSLLENNRQRLDGLVTAASLEYNLGNAKSALADLHTPHPFITPGLADHDLLLAAKNHYWKALKTHDRNDRFAHRLRTNLGNALRKSGRITEALIAYDDIIADDPTFTMAHFHRGLALLVLEQLGGARTANLLRQAATEYALAADAADARPGVRDVAATMRDHTAKRLKACGHNTERLQRENQETTGASRLPSAEDPNDPAYRQVLHYVMYPSFSISWWTLCVQLIWSSTAERREATQLSACAA
jgi:tetratricopeptide (TPR) repeat protein